MLSLTDLFHRTTDGVFAIDAKQRIILWNPACSHLFGISAEEAIGRPCSEVIHGETPMGQSFCDKGCCVPRLTNGGSSSKTFSLRTQNKAGEEMGLSVTIILVPFLQDSQWACVHLLHREAVVNTLEDMADSAPLQLPASANGTIPSPGSGISPLSGREQEVLQLMSEGHHAPEISRQLKIKLVTVRNHMQHIQEKLGVHSQMETVAYAYRHQLVQGVRFSSRSPNHASTVPA